MKAYVTGDEGMVQEIIKTLVNLDFTIVDSRKYDSVRKLEQDKKECCTHIYAISNNSDLSYYDILELCYSIMSKCCVIVVLHNQQKFGQELTEFVKGLSLFANCENLEIVPFHMFENFIKYLRSVCKFNKQEVDKVQRSL